MPTELAPYALTEHKGQAALRVTDGYTSMSKTITRQAMSMDIDKILVCHIHLILPNQPRKSRCLIISAIILEESRFLGLVLKEENRQ